MVLGRVHEVTLAYSRAPPKGLRTNMFSAQLQMAAEHHSTTSKNDRFKKQTWQALIAKVNHTL